MRLYTIEIQGKEYVAVENKDKKLVTLEATGTPGGVGMGFKPPKFLKPGDVVRCVIEGIGELTNTVAL
jgi:hypothetical protein